MYFAFWCWPINCISGFVLFTCAILYSGPPTLAFFFPLFISENNWHAFFMLLSYLQYMSEWGSFNINMITYKVIAWTQTPLLTLQCYLTFLLCNCIAFHNNVHTYYIVTSKSDNSRSRVAPRYRFIKF